MPKARWFRRAWQVALGAIALLALTIVLTARHGDARLYPTRENPVTIYVLNYGFHTDIALPADKVFARGGRLAEAARAAGDGRWLMVGWGDKSFYTGTGFSFERAGDGLRSLFWPGNPSVVRVRGLDTQPDRAFVNTDTAALELSSEGFEAMVRSIEASFLVEPGDQLVASAMPDMRGAFFPARGNFSILHTCNNWTSDQLAAAGLPNTPMIDGWAAFLSLDLSWRAGVKWRR